MGHTFSHRLLTASKGRDEYITQVRPLRGSTRGCREHKAGAPRGIPRRCACLCSQPPRNDSARNEWGGSGTRLCRNQRRANAVRPYKNDEGRRGIPRRSAPRNDSVKRNKERAQPFDRSGFSDKRAPTRANGGRMQFAPTRERQRRRSAGSIAVLH